MSDAVPNVPNPASTPEMQILWNRAMMLARTRGAYGVGFPEPGTSFPLPTPGTMLHDLLFVCTATEEEYDQTLAAIRENMEAWKERVRQAGRGKNAISLVRAQIDTSKLDFRL